MGNLKVTELTVILAAAIESTDPLYIVKVSDGTDKQIILGELAKAIANNLIFTPDASSPAHLEGQLYYDDIEKTLVFDNDEPDVRLSIGRELWIEARNATGSTISDGKVVYISGAVGQVPTIALAKADARPTSETIGIATHNIENNTNGYVTTFGIVRDIDTSAWSDGDMLFLSAATAGELTNTKPSVDNYPVPVAHVAHSHPTAGKLLVRPGSPLDQTDIKGVGDMLISLYDPTAVSGDAFSMDNMVETATKKILSNTERTKLTGIEAAADVTDTANVTAAGALMDSEVDANLKTFVLPASTTISSFIKTLLDDTTAAAARTTIGAGTLDNVVEDTAPQLGGNLDAQNNSITNIDDIEIQGHSFADGEVDNGNSGTADTIDYTTGNFQKSTLTDNVTYTFTAPSGPTTIILRLVQDATGSRVATWPATVKWPGGATPTLTTTASAVDIVSFYFDGTNYHGAIILDSK